MQALSLVGKWKLIRDGSDFVPGLDKLKNSPIVLKLLGKSETEFLKIEKKKALDVEELCLTYVTSGMAVGTCYQLGRLNSDYTHQSEIVFSVVQNINENFTEFTVLRLGPGSGQMSREVYTLDIANNEIKLDIEVNSGDGLHIKLIKYLTRFDDIQSTNDIIFDSWQLTKGWNRPEFCSINILSECKTLLVKAVLIQTNNIQSKQEHKIMDILWTRNGFIDDFKLDMNSLIRQVSGKNKSGEDVIVFITQVTVNGVSWYVAHRYTEFLLLKNFILHQNPNVTELRNMKPRFPGKAMGVAYRRGVLERRIEGLGAFLLHCLQNGKVCKQTSIDALCSFLSIPEQLQRLLEPNQRTIAAPRDPATAASLTSAAALATKNANSTMTRGSGTEGAIAGAQGRQNSTDSASSTPQQALWTLLGKKGMTVIKHGRQGAPKQRVLHCAPDATLLYWGDKSAYKSVFLDEVREIRLGTDIDPIATPAHLNPSLPPPSISQQRAKRTSSGRLLKSNSGILLKTNSLNKIDTGSESGSGKGSIVYGTEILRRTCKKEDMALALSLILPTRTFDIQCKTQQDFDRLLTALRAVCPPALS